MTDVFGELTGGVGDEAVSDIERKRHHDKLMRGVALLMDSADGRALCRDVLEWSGALSASYAADSGAMYYMQGQRSVGFHLLDLLKQQDSDNLAAILTPEQS